MQFTKHAHTHQTRKQPKIIWAKTRKDFMCPSSVYIHVHMCFVNLLSPRQPMSSVTHCMYSVNERADFRPAGNGIWAGGYVSRIAEMRDRDTTGVNLVCKALFSRLSISICRWSIIIFAPSVCLFATISSSAQKTAWKKIYSRDEYKCTPAWCECFGQIFLHGKCVSQQRRCQWRSFAEHKNLLLVDWRRCQITFWFWPASQDVDCYVCENWPKMRVNKRCSTREGGGTASAWDRKRHALHACGSKSVLSIFRRENSDCKMQLFWAESTNLFVLFPTVRNAELGRKNWRLFSQNWQTVDAVEDFPFHKTSLCAFKNFVGSVFSATLVFLWPLNPTFASLDGLDPRKCFSCPLLFLWAPWLASAASELYKVSVHMHPVTGGLRLNLREQWFMSVRSLHGDNK